MDSMKLYKKRFEQRHGIRWEYENDKNIERFKLRKQAVQRLRPNRNAHRHRGKKAKLFDIDVSHYLSDKDGTTEDIFSSKAGGERNGAEGLSSAFNGSFLEMLKSPSGFFSESLRQKRNDNAGKLQSQEMININDVNSDGGENSIRKNTRNDVFYHQSGIPRTPLTN